MATRTTEFEKELMWNFYQQNDVIKAVAEKVGRNTSTVSRYVRDYEVAIHAAGSILNQKLYGGY